MESAELSPKPGGDVKLDTAANVVGVAGPNGKEPDPFAAAVPVKLIQSTSAVSMLDMVNPCRPACAVKAFCAVAPVVIVPEQFVAVTFTEPAVLTPVP